MYKPVTPFSVALSLLVPTYSSVSGVAVKSFPNTGERFNGSFRTYGGTERDVSGVFSVEETAVIETWYRPDITSECRIKVESTGAVFEILGSPENIEMRNQYLKFKVRRVKGGA